MDSPLKLGAAALAAADTSERTITGRVLVFGQPSSSQRVILQAGAITPREPLGRVKLLLDHDKTQPVGQLTAIEFDAEGATATFSIPDTPAASAALDQARAGLRDGLSVGLAPTQETTGPNGERVIVAAELLEVSLVAVPDFAAASVTSVNASATTDTPQQKEPDMPQPVNASAEQPQHTPPPAPPAATTAPRPIDLAGVCSTLAEAYSGGSPEAVQLAISKVLPSSDPGNASGIMGPGWIDKLWSASRVDRSWIDAFGGPKPLTEAIHSGPQWVRKPKVQKYAGDLAEVGSNEIETKMVTWTAEEWAGAWKAPQKLVHFAKPSFWAEFWEHVIDSYRHASNADAGTKIVAKATASTVDDAATPLAGIKALRREMHGIGASADRLFLAADVFDQLIDMKRSDVPFWLAGAVGGVDFAEGARLPGIEVHLAADLEEKTIVACDSRAATIRELSPLQVRGLDVAHMGHDLGVWGAGMVQISDPAAIRKLTLAG